MLVRSILFNTLFYLNLLVHSHADGSDRWGTWLLPTADGGQNTQWTYPGQPNLYTAAATGINRILFDPNGATGSWQIELYYRIATPQLTSTSHQPDRWTPNRQFTATWTVASIARSYPQTWTTTAAMKDAIAASLFGVELLQPVDHYRMASRSAASERPR